MYTNTIQLAGVQNVGSNEIWVRARVKYTSIRAHSWLVYSSGQGYLVFLFFKSDISSVSGTASTYLYGSSEIFLSNFLAGVSAASRDFLVALAGHCTSFLSAYQHYAFFISFGADFRTVSVLLGYS